MAIKFSTFNINGINKKKIYFLCDFLTKYNVDVCFLQETHLKEKEIIRFFKETLVTFDLYFTKTVNNSKGVAICIKRDVGIKFVSECFDNENRLHSVRLDINNNTFNFFNIYSPNLSVDQNDFIECLHNFMSGKKNIVLGGDFNYVEDRVSEKNNNNNWKDLYKNFNLKEIEWSVSGLDLKECCTWTNGHQSSRIDRIYCQDNLSKMFKYVNILETTVSDHKFVLCEIDTKTGTTKKNNTNLWKLNESVLESERVHDGIIKICNSIPDLINENERRNIWYDKFIFKITNFLKHESRIINKEKKQKINELFEKLRTLDNLSEKRLKKEQEEIKKDVKKYYDDLRKGNEVRVRNDKIKFTKQPTKVLLKEEIKQHQSCLINEYETENKLKTKKVDVIKNDIYKFYYNLLGNDFVSDEKINNYKFSIDKLNVDENMHESLNRNITYEEVSKVIKGMKCSAPGSSGLTIGFYKKYFEFFGMFFINLINNKDELPSVFMESIVKLIPKNNNNLKNINDLRPISLTNIDYRIYTKVLANRLRLISGNIIGDHQTCSIPNRRINDNLTLIRDIIHENNINNSELYILSVDQSKAFDRISHKYLFRLLEHLNFGSFILDAIKKIYNKSCAKIFVNNSMCDLIYIISGLK
jgi:exonuclease III